MRLSGTLGIVLLLLPQGVPADIFEWRDAGGARHFTNHRETVPAAHRDSVAVLIVDVPRVDPPAVAAREPLPVPAASVPGLTEAEDRYLEGLRAGLRLAGEPGGGGGGGGGAAAEGGGGGAVEINAPLAVTTVHVAEPGGAFGFPAEFWPGYFPLVTTGFDRGRSRHQTIRMLLQDQFQIDRDGPYAYDRWTQPGLGPALSPVLPRGLPFPVRQYGRVLYR